MGVYAFVLLAILRAVNLPPSQFGAVPPFLLIFLLIALSGLRYTPLGVAIVVSVGTLIGLSVLLAGREGWLAGWWDAPGLQGPPILFASGENLMRLTMVATTGLLTVVTVQRSRNLLIRGIELTQHTANLSRYLPRRIADVRMADWSAFLRGSLPPSTAPKRWEMARPGRERVVKFARRAIRWHIHIVWIENRRRGLLPQVDGWEGSGSRPRRASTGMVRCDEWPESAKARIGGRGVPQPRRCS